MEINLIFFPEVLLMKIMSFSNHSNHYSQPKNRPQTAIVNSFRKRNEILDSKQTHKKIHMIHSNISEPSTPSYGQSVLLNTTMNSKRKNEDQKQAKLSSSLPRSFCREQIRKNSNVSKQNTENMTKTQQISRKIEPEIRGNLCKRGRFLKTRAVMVWEIPGFKKTEKSNTICPIRYGHKQSYYEHSRKDMEKKPTQNKQPKFEIGSWQSQQSVQFSDLFMKNWQS